MTTSASVQSQLAEHRSYLLRFARLQLRNDAWAEDAVSETLLAALSKPQSFGNKSQLKTWLVGILKHKVLDAFRHNAREVSLDAAPDSYGHEELDSLMFKSDGHFAQAPADWGNPEQELSSRQFFVVLEACTEKMPAALGRVFNLPTAWWERAVGFKGGSVAMDLVFAPRPIESSKSVHTH